MNSSRLAAVLSSRLLLFAHSVGYCGAAACPELGVSEEKDSTFTLHRDAVREHVATWTKRAADADAKIAAVNAANELWKQLPGVSAVGAAGLYQLGETVWTQAAPRACSAWVRRAGSVSPPVSHGFRLTRPEFRCPRGAVCEPDQ